MAAMPTPSIPKQRISLLTHQVKADAKDSSQAWTSVNKTLIEDLFDHLLRSFDNVHVVGPETVESRGRSSANQRSSASGPDDVTAERKLWRSVAYKWKSDILQRLRSQQVTSQAPANSRKRRYAERNVELPHSAYELGVLDG